MATLIDDALQQVATFAGATVAPHSADAPIGQRMAAALGWQLGSARLEQLNARGTGLKLSRGFLGPQPATVFAANGTDATHRFLPDAARFAYHSSIHWGVVADERGAVVFNSHWIRGEQWFRLPEIRWSEIDRHRDLLAAITPQGMAAGALDRLATRIFTPDRFLTPVDDALVARLDYWRREALVRGRDASNLDEDLHILFAQLFVLRAVEDRTLAPEIPPLESAVIGERVDTERLRKVFGQARMAV